MLSARWRHEMCKATKNSHDATFDHLAVPYMKQGFVESNEGGIRVFFMDCALRFREGNLKRIVPRLKKRKNMVALLLKQCHTCP